MKEIATEFFWGFVLLVPTLVITMLVLGSIGYVLESIAKLWKRRSSEHQDPGEKDS